MDWLRIIKRVLKGLFAYYEKRFKGTVSVITTDPLCEDGKVLSISR